MRTNHARTTPKSLRLVPLVAALAAAGLPVHAATFTVTNNLDSGAGSLRQAISDANSACLMTPLGNTTPVINFSGPFTIGLNSALPQFQCSFTAFSPTINGTGVTIDGLNATFGAGLSALMYGGTMTVTGVTMLHWMYGAAISASTGGSASGGLTVSNVTLTNNTVGIQNNGGALNVSGSNINNNSTRAITGSATSGILQNNTITGNLAGGIDVSGSGLTIRNSNISSNNGPGIRLTGSNTTVTLNTLSGNSGSGVQIDSGTGNRITNNSILNNDDGILLAYGGTNQDFGDPDTGPNDGQNYPDILSVGHAGGSTQISFAFNSTPSSTFRLEFYENDIAGVTQGKTFLGALTVTTDSSGYATTTTYTVPGLRDNISAIAISAGNNTSQFSSAVAFVPAPAVTVSPTSLAFGNVAINSSASRIVTLSSVGDENYGIYDIEFNTSPTCYGGTIAYGGLMFSTSCQTFGDEVDYPPGTGCQINVSFAPTTLGFQSGYLCVYDNAPTSFIRSIPVSGNGVVPPVISLLPSTWDFGSVAVGNTSPTQSFVVSSGGTTPVNYTIFLDQPFSLVDTNCPNPLLPGTRCNILVNFKPLTEDSFMGILNLVPTNGSSATSTLFGKGVVAPDFTVPATIDFTYALGRDPTIRDLQITNRGNAPLQITSVTVSGNGFSVENNCTATVAPGESCLLRLRYATTETGTNLGSLTIGSNVPTGVRIVELIGITQTAPVPVLAITPSEMNYGSRAFGTTSPVQTVTIRNVGGAPAIITSILTSPDFFLASNTCPTSLAPAASCTATVAMAATTYGRRVGAVTITSNEERSPQRVIISGISCRNASPTLGRLAITSGCQP